VCDDLAELHSHLHHAAPFLLKRFLQAFDFLVIGVASLG
jgi:hypothetical protein